MRLGGDQNLQRGFYGLNCRQRMDHAILRNFREDLKPVPAAQIVDPTWTLTQLFFRRASLSERSVDPRPFFESQLCPFASARRLLHVFKYCPQDVLNGNPNIRRFIRCMDWDRLWISLMVFQCYREHGRVHGGGMYLFFWKVVLMVRLSVHVNLEKVLGQYRVHDQWD
jgi:hypothetical protein